MCSCLIPPSRQPSKGSAVESVRRQMADDDENNPFANQYPQGLEGQSGQWYHDRNRYASGHDFREPGATNQSAAWSTALDEHVSTWSIQRIIINSRIFWFKFKIAISIWHEKWWKHSVLDTDIWINEKWGKQRLGRYTSYKKMDDLSTLQLYI